MAVQIPRVKAGDLIRYQDWNLMADTIEDLVVKVANLAATGGSGVHITSVTSNVSPIRVNSRITVTGTGFVMPSQLNNVTVGGVTIDANAFTFASDSQHLIFDVPTVPGLSATGTVVSLTVVNANGSATTSFVLQPAESLPSGTIEVFYSSAPVMPDTELNITANRNYIFTYTVRTAVDLAASYSVVPNLTGQAGWTAVVLEDAVDQPRASSTFSIAGGINVDTVVRVRVNVPNGAAAAAAATLVLNVTSAAPGTGITPGMSSPIAITVGSPPPTPETRARITLRSAVNAGGRVQLTRNTPGGVNLNLIVTDPGQFVMSGAFRTAGAGTVNPMVGANIVTATPAAPTAQPFTAVVNPGGTAMNTELVVTVRRGSPVNLQVEYWVPVTIV
jgi:hypothetical protein